MATAEFAFNNKVYIVTKLSSFKINFEQELRIGFEKKRGKHVKAEKFVKEIEKMYEEAKAVLKK